MANDGVGIGPEPDSLFHTASDDDKARLKALGGFAHDTHGLSGLDPNSGRDRGGNMLLAQALDSSGRLNARAGGRVYDDEPRAAMGRQLRGKREHAAAGGPKVNGAEDHPWRIGCRERFVAPARSGTHRALGGMQYFGGYGSQITITASVAAS